ncbi:TnsA-like heteromeric transposase endonuclease subunit [Arthrobacter castelli]|uniref:TnsA-like heteromeric transposase endonuclease subunit n=1 Tax=Arthrobacter castelli TaxID=271431 RepID=UPI0012DBE8B1|nr:TnsA-like heteromeric transposase endonuclease subunit [Arthrobacter castelli]
MIFSAFHDPGVVFSGFRDPREQTCCMGQAVGLDVTAEYLCRDRGEVSTAWLKADPASIIAGRPIRVPGSHAGQSNYPGLFWSSTMDAHLCYESLLELDWLWLADFDKHVTAIASQPLWIHGHIDGKARRHAPDFLLNSSKHWYVVVDVKPAVAADRPEVREVFRWTASLCAARGWGYEVWTGADAQMLRNIRFLGSARRSELVHDSAVAAVLACFEPGMTIEAVTRSAAGFGRPATQAAVLHLLWRQILQTDLDVPLSAGSVLDIGMGAAHVEH